MHDFQGDEFVVGGVGGGDEEEGGVAAVDYFGVCWVKRVSEWVSKWLGNVRLEVVGLGLRERSWGG